LPLARFIHAERDGSFFVTAIDGASAGLRARVLRLDRGDGRFMGSYVSLDSLDLKERLLLERSAVEANDAIARVLPRPDSAGPGFRVGGFLNPNPSGTGDCFGVFRADARGFGFYGLDVMGHGIMAALMAYSLHDLIPTLGSCRGGESQSPKPDEVIRLLNERYKGFGDRHEAPFFTIAYGVVDSYTGEFSIARAGHSPVLQLSALGGARFLETQGAAIGVFDVLETRPGLGVLESGDRLLLASDGLLDAFDEDDVGAAKRAFASFAESRRDLGLNEFAEEFYELDADRRSKQALVDDSSLLIIERG
jgi:phosphoserine phosphatase RsbU/P